MNGTGWTRDDGAARRAAEEAVRLLQTLTEVTGSHDAPECQICPVCQLLAALRQVRPEAVEHLIDAAAQFASALRDLAVPVPSGATASGAAARPSSSSASSSAASASSQAEPDAEPDAEPAAHGDRPRVQRIDVTD